MMALLGKQAVVIGAGIGGLAAAGAIGEFFESLSLNSKLICQSTQEIRHA